MSDLGREATGAAAQVTVHDDPTGPTPSQTVGPFFHFGFEWLADGELVAEDHPGAVVLTGRVTDGAGEPVPDAVIEIWQADADGHLGAGAAWTGFGRSLTDGEGRYRFVTVRPGPVADGGAPHLAVTVLARGLLQRLVTRLYLPGEAANDLDPLLAALPPERRATLVAGSDDPGRLTWDIRLQGEGETVFVSW